MSIQCQTETPGAFRQTITINAHTLHADLGLAAGGQDSAPGAHDLFDASLAACKALTAARYAKTKGFALDRVEAFVERDDSKEAEGSYVLRVKLGFFGALSEQEKQRIYSVVSHCPIHKLMTSSTVEIETAAL
jgi:putative redox protein